MDEVEHAAFAAQVVVERDVERDANAVVLGRRPARQLVPLALDDVGGLEQLDSEQAEPLCQATGLRERLTQPVRTIHEAVNRHATARRGSLGRSWAREARNACSKTASWCAA
jgi:hypothetical protein